jgi:hypothetical protein
MVFLHALVITAAIAVSFVTGAALPQTGPPGLGAPTIPLIPGTNINTTTNPWLLLPPGTPSLPAPNAVLPSTPPFTPFFAGWNSFSVFTPPSAGQPLVASRDFNSGCGYMGTMTFGVFPQPGWLGNIMGTSKCFDYCYSNHFAWARCGGSSTVGWYCQCGTTLPPTVV